MRGSSINYFQRSKYW